MPMMDRNEFERLILQIDREPASRSDLRALVTTARAGSQPVAPDLSARRVEEADVHDDQAAGNRRAIVDRDETQGNR